MDAASPPPMEPPAVHPGKSARRRPSASPVGRRSPALHAFMVVYLRRFFARHMNALRLAEWGAPDLRAGGPVVIYSNHPAWWDAALYVLAADLLLPEYESYAPIDAAMLKRYGVFGRIGAFGVDLESSRGAADFLVAAVDILESPTRALWITAQGRFADVRQRPLGVKAGIARVPELAPESMVLPLAIEYAFWQERGAEAFIAFGPPRSGRDLLALPRPARLAALEDGLTETLDRLSADVRRRDPARFRTLLAGRAGIGGIYDAWRRLRAAAGGRAFDASHEAGRRER